MRTLDKCKQIIDTESGRVLLYRDEVEEVLTAGDCISRAVAIEAVDDLPNCYNGYSDTYDKACIIGVLEQLPSAQPEIIRCKDCVYVSPNTKKGCELRRWRWFDGSEFMDGDDYCSRAERREE